MLARFLVLLSSGVAASTVALAAQTGTPAPESLISQVETALGRGDREGAAKAFDALVDVRRGKETGLAPDPELNGLYGRMHDAFGDQSVARAYLERADAPQVSPARRAATLLALASTELAHGDFRRAAATLAKVDTAVLAPEDRTRAVVLRARASLPVDPARALATLGGAEGWQADWVRGQAHLLLGDRASARLAADRAWSAAADAPLRSGAVARTALLRAGLALAEGRRERQVAMLAIAGAAEARLDPALLYNLPLCESGGLTRDDHVTFGVERDANGRASLFPLGASRPAAVAPFVDALGLGVSFAQGGDKPGGTMFTARCRSSGTGGFPYGRAADPWAARLADTGLFISMDLAPDDKGLNAKADRFDRWKAQLGANNPALLGVAIDLSLGLSNRAILGDVEPARVLEAQKRVRALAVALGGADGLMPTDADIEAMRRIATASTPELRAQLARDRLRHLVGRFPPDLAFRVVQQWFDDDAKPAAADRLAIVDQLIARLPQQPDDKRMRALLLRKASAHRDLGQFAQGRAARSAAGVPETSCTMGDTEPLSEKLGVTPEDYPDDLAGVAFEGSTAFELDLDRAGRVLGRRLIYSAPGGLFDEAATAALPRFAFAPAQRGGRAIACNGHQLTIMWRMEEEAEPMIFPDLTVSPDMSSS